MASDDTKPKSDQTGSESPITSEGMFRSSDDVRSSFISGIEAFTVKPVEYSAINGRAIFEGDILLGTVEQMEAVRAQLEGPGTREKISISGTAQPASDIQFGVGITGQRFRWPNGVVPFTVVALSCAPSSSRPFSTGSRTRGSGSWNEPRPTRRNFRTGLRSKCRTGAFPL